jgi:hypothetical protein
MFGFGQLASYDYFVHLRCALTERLRAEGMEVETHVALVSPTASIRRRARTLTELVANTCGEGDGSGSIHLIGHSTGGLDARLVASPSAALAAPPEKLAWRSRLASVTTINAPHYGTPLASFFATVSGQRMLRAISALTVVALSVGSTPLSLAGALIALFGRVDEVVGLDLKLIDQTTDAMLRTINEARGREILDYINTLKKDSGGMVQLMPEAMDLFVAGIEDRPGVLYQSTASMAPRPSPLTFLASLGGRWSAVSGLLFDFLYEVTSRCDPYYPCAAAHHTKENEQVLMASFGVVPDLRANDGVVPIGSQVWGTLVWAGYGDHLDVIGHFRDDKPSAGQGRAGRHLHVDWLSSGSRFDRARFEELVRAIATGILASARSRVGASNEA